MTKHLGEKMRYTLYVSTFLSALTLSAVSTADSGETGYYHHGMMGGYGGMVAGPLMMILMLALSVIVIVVILRWLGVIDPSKSNNQGHGNQNGALSILKKRYANGEIDKAEYEEKHSLLKD